MNRVALKTAAAVKRVMPVSDDARFTMCGQILAQPFLLLGTRTASADARRRTIRIEYDHMPTPELVTVIAFSRRPRPLSPIFEIDFTALRVIFMVPRSWPGPVFELSPGRVITLMQLFPCSPSLPHIPNAENRSSNLFS